MKLPARRFDPRRSAARIAASAALAVALAAAAAAAIPFLTPARPGEAWTVNGETYWLTNIELTTPRNFDEKPAGAPSYVFKAEPADLPFADVQQLVFSPLTRRILGSAPEKMEYYPLGDVRRAAPPPPNWKRTIDQIPPWQRAVALGNVDHLPFLNDAVFCWTGQTDTSPTQSAAEPSSGVYLFRQAFQIDHPERIVRATLHLATNAETIDAALNESELHLAPPLPRTLASYEVTPLLRAGENIFAIEVRERPGRLEPSYGLAFSLEVEEPAANAAPPPRPEGAALALSRSGDRVWGWADELQGNVARMQTPFGVWRQDLAGLSGMLFPSGWKDPPADPGLIQGIFGGSPAPVAAAPKIGLPFALEPDALEDSLLLTEGRTATAKPSYLRGEDLYCEDKDGNRYSIPRAQVLGVYPPRPVEWTFRRPQREDAILYCRLTTNGGERIGGLLRKLDGGEAVLESDGGSIMTLKPAWISTISFPYHAPGEKIAAGESAPPVKGRIGILPQAAGQEAFRATYLGDVREVQGAAFSIGAPCDNLELKTLADAGELTPQEYPALVSVDPAGEYLNTLNAPGDARSALVNYLEKGGVVVALSRGGAFRTALVPGENGLRRTADETQQPSLLGLLGLAIARPGERAPGAGALAFNHPPNAAREIYFERSSEAPRGLSGLPRRIPLASMPSARFFPMVSTEQAGKVIYRVADDGGGSYGPALSLIPKGRGTIVLIDHLLWNSRPDDQDFGDRILPAVLRWAVDAGGE